MPALAELQAAFRDAILGNDVGALAALVVEDGIPAEQRLQIYRNNTFISLTEALSATFPVIRRLVGDDFFQQAAQAFIRAHPPRVRVLFAYGAAFPAFLATCPGVEPHPYLGDVARLEWAWNQAYHAADAAALSAERLAAVAPQDWERARLGLHPSARLLTSPYPVAAIWRANQGGAPEETIDLAAGAAHLLVIRPLAEVRIVALAPAAFDFLAALAAGVPLAAAATVGCDPTATLTDALVGGYFADLQVDPN